MPIRVYPSALDGEPLEIHQTDRTMSVLDWMVENVPTFRYDADHKISVSVNGVRCPVSDWPLTQFGPDADVRIVVEPEGIELIVGAIIAAVAVAASFIMMRRVNRPQQQAERQTGASLGDERISANAPRLGEPIPEIAGSPIRHPDYLLPPHRWFDTADDGTVPLKSDQYIDVLLCVGAGRYLIDDLSVMVGDTPAHKLSDGRFTYAFYNPGEDLSGVPNEPYRWWHTSEEVGFTSFGGAGIELQGSDSGQDEGGTIPEWGAYTVAPLPTSAEPRALLGTPLGSLAAVPTQWRVGMTVRVEASWSVMLHTIGGVDTISSSFLNTLDLEVGDEIQVMNRGGSPDNATPGTYVLEEIIPAGGGLPQRYRFNASPTGQSGRATIGFPGYVYRVLQINKDSIVVAPVQRPDWGGFPVGDDDPAQLTVRVRVVSLGGDDEEHEAEQGWQGWFTACPVGEVADRLELDLVMPGGWGHYEDDGRLVDLHGRLEIQVRYSDDPTIHNYSREWIGHTPNQWGFTHHITLDPPGRVDVRARLNPGPRGSHQYADRVQWSGLKSRIVGAPTSYEGVTVMAARMKIGDAIGSGAENKISLRAERILPTVDDPNVTASTRDIAPFVLHVLESVGYSRDQIDMTTLSNFHGIWDTREDTFDAVIDSETTVKSIVNHALAAGFAELTMRDGQLSFVRDVRRSGLVSRVFSPQQYTAPLIETTSAPQPDDIDGVDAEYRDYVTGKTETIQYRLSGDAGLRVQKLSLVGVTAAGKAFQLAARARRIAAYRRTEYSGQTEMQAMNCGYLDHIGLQDGIPEYGQSAYVVGRSGNVLALSEPVEPGTQVLAMVRRDGSMTAPVAVSAVDGNRVTVASVPITPVLPGTSADPTIVYLGTEARWMAPALMTSVEPKNDGTTAFRAVNYDERIYADDEADPLPTAWLESMGNLVLWLDAYERGLIIEGAGGVSNMHDKSQAGNDAWQDVPAKQPILAGDLFLPRALRFTLVGEN